MAFITPGASGSQIATARRDETTGLILTTVRGTDGYILVDPASGSVVGAVGVTIPGDTEHDPTKARAGGSL